MHQVDIQAYEEHYHVNIGSGLLQNKRLMHELMPSQRLLIISNEQVAKHYWPPLQLSLIDFDCQLYIVADGEQYKSLATVEQIYHVLINGGYHRDSCIVALGGGVVGDMAGFVAATWHRGISFVQIPTTLLAMVDASVGGKTAVNMGQGKNVVGAFYPPNAVIIDTDSLKTLPEREFRAGMAEVIKYALITGEPFTQQLETFLHRKDHEDKEYAELIANCVEIKADIVQRDLREKGERALLNLGHTFAHALEAVTQWKRWLHGEAVGIGLYCAALMSHMRGHFSNLEVKKVKNLLKLAGLRHTIPKDIDLNALRLCMQHDKKMQQDKLRFILLRSFGDCFIADDVDEDLLMAVLNRACEGRE